MTLHLAPAEWAAIAAAGSGVVFRAGDPLDVARCETCEGCGWIVEGQTYLSPEGEQVQCPNTDCLDGKRRVAVVVPCETCAESVSVHNATTPTPGMVPCRGDHWPGTPCVRCGGSLMMACPQCGDVDLARPMLCEVHADSEWPHDLFNGKPCHGPGMWLPNRDGTGLITVGHVVVTWGPDLQDDGQYAIGVEVVSASS